MRCYIFSSAKIEDYSFLKEFNFENSFIICADGGYLHAKEIGIVPDVWLGDGDSLGDIEICAKEKIDFPARKDKTDTDLAVELAASRGYKKIVIFGGLGGRLDHEYANLCLLKKICDLGGEGVLVNEKNEIFLRKEGFELYPNSKKYVSFFPFGGDVINFSVKGLRYEAEGLRLESSKAQASSNCFDGCEKAVVSFDSGYVLTIRSND